jgi:hypothetical protein
LYSNWDKRKGMRPLHFQIPLHQRHRLSIWWWCWVQYRRLLGSKRPVRLLVFLQLSVGWLLVREERCSWGVVDLILAMFLELLGWYLWRLPSQHTIKRFIGLLKEVWIGGIFILLRK